MAAVESTALKHATPRCTHCGEVIGVYEPAIQVAGETRRTVSRAAQPELASNAAAVYHAVCYELIPDPTG